MKQLRQCFFVQVGADYAQATDDGSRAVSDLRFTGHVIKVDPLSILACDNSLRAKNDTVLEDVLQLS